MHSLVGNPSVPSALSAAESADGTLIPNSLANVFRFSAKAFCFSESAKSAGVGPSCSLARHISHHVRSSLTICDVVGISGKLQPDPMTSVKGGRAPAVALARFL